MSIGVRILGDMKMPKYNRDQLNMMASKIDLVEYIGQTECLHKNGKNYFICCPFHNGDDTPSLCINPDTQRWHCFGCGAGTDIYNWIMQKDNIGFHEAVKKVAKLVDMPIETTIESESIAKLKEINKSVELKPVKSTERQILNWNKDYYDKYSDECPEEWLSEDMTEEALKYYNIRIDHAHNRIVYPVLDSNNQLIGVKGRTRIAAYKEMGINKYSNYYKIGTIDYFQGYQQAEFKNNTIVIFEGIKSCIKAYGWGYKNTVSSETSALTEGQIHVLLKGGFSEVIIAWDKDQSFSHIVNNSKIQTLKRFTNVSIVNDTKGLLNDKMAPVDKGREIYETLLKTRRVL